MIRQFSLEYPITVNIRLLNTRQTNKYKTIPILPSKNTQVDFQKFRPTTLSSYIALQLPFTNINNVILNAEQGIIHKTSINRLSLT
ncbi:hypothetical protein KSF78_0003290 [Schistosoma japonicum]|nr:hypothetical protein KSF78_0003290 [Schistosoma japonicum]